MGIIGIACNPQSGKDIRRLFTAATTIDDTEKLNILERIVLAAAAVGDQKVYLMPDRLGYGRLLLQKRQIPGYPGDLSQLEIYDMERTDTQADTVFFAAEMERIGADALIVMGGDGTSRAAAKGTRHVPMLSMSTGTNNVYPELMEGTVAGMAAAVLAGHMPPAAECARPAKCIEVWKNGSFVDLALIDLVFCRNPFVGSKAIWEYEEIDQVVVTQCSMASIGFSALVGTSLHVDREDDWGASAEFTGGAPNTLAPMGAGTVRGVHIQNVCRLPLGEPVTRTMTYQGTLALDGEREIFFQPGDVITCAVTRNGPMRVDARRAIEYARTHGCYQLRQEETA